MRRLGVLGMGFMAALSLVPFVSPFPALAQGERLDCPATFEGWDIYAPPGDHDEQNFLGDFSQSCIFQAPVGDNPIIGIGWTESASSGGTLGACGPSKAETQDSNYIERSLSSTTQEAAAYYRMPSGFSDPESVRRLAQGLLAEAEARAVGCDGAPTVAEPGAVTCPRSLEGIPLATDERTLASEAKYDAAHAEIGIGHTGCSYFGASLPGGLPNDATLSVSWSLSPEQTTALAGAAPCEGQTNIKRSPGGVVAASGTKEVTAVGHWNRAGPVPESFVGALTDLVKQAEPLAIACPGAGAPGDTGSGSTDQSGDEGATGATSSGNGGIPTDAEILIAAGLIMSLLGGVTTFANLPSRLKRVNRELADDVFLADVEVPDAGLLLVPSEPLSPPDFNQAVFEELTAAPALEPPKRVRPVDDEWLPTKAPDKHFQPGDLNHPMNQQPTVGHDQFVDWLHNVEAVNPGKTWQQITTAVHNSLYMGVDAHDTFPLIGVPLFVDGPATDGWQDVRFPTKKVPQWVLDPQGRKVDLGHVMAGIRSDFNREPGRSREMEQWGNTDGGDLWQVVLEPFVATLDGIWHRHVPHYVDRAPPDQLRGNQVSLSVRSFYRDPTNAHAPLSKYFEEQFSDPSP